MSADMAQPTFWEGAHVLRPDEIPVLCPARLHCMAGPAGHDGDHGNWMWIEFERTAPLDLGQPRMWTLPPEPGPEVTAVRDRDGDRWIRVSVSPSRWQLADGRGLLHFWADLFQFAPLTDATGDV